MKIRRIISGLIVGVSLISFIGCGDKKTYDIKFNPSSGEEYSATSIIKMDATAKGQKLAIDANVKCNIKYVDVSKDEITEEMKYDDFDMNMNIGGAISVEINEDNDMFKDVISELKSSKITVTVDREGNVLTYDIEGGEALKSKADSLNLISKDSAFSVDNACMLENIKVKEGEEIIIPLDKLLGKDTENKLGVNFEDSKLIEKVKSIKNNVAEINFNIDSMKLGENDATLKDFKCNMKVNVKTGITENINVNAKLEGLIEGTIDIKNTMKKK